MAQVVLDVLARELPDAIIEAGSYVGDEMALVHKERIVDVLQLLRDSPETKMEMLTDLTVVDYLGQEPRFEVVYHLYSLSLKHRVRIKAGLKDESKAECWIPSCCSLWKSANWSEREAFDLYGVDFRGHPDMRRILMYEEFVGHPLRKDYPQNARQPLVRRPDAPPTDDLTQRLRPDSHNRGVE
jgi:NADH-quinone oxidoreductase subunit C